MNEGARASDRPNLLFFLADQLRASSLPLYGEHQIETPHINRLARKGITFDHMVSSCPVCVPYRSMLMTGKHPQSTGHVVNFVRTRHDEIGFGDVFRQCGYRTGYVGKWHLHTGSFPEIQGKDYVPEGRDRLGFDYWRAYNFHMEYFGGWVNADDWRCEQWQGYETDGLNRYAIDFINRADDRPFCLFVSPHQPHVTPLKSAPESYYRLLPDRLELPANVPAECKEQSTAEYRHYLAMILAVDDMLGRLLDHLEETGEIDRTLIVFTSDHGSQFGAHGIEPWAKMQPYEESLRVPLIVSWPGVLAADTRNDSLVSPVDFLPTLCRLCGIAPPGGIEGVDLSEAWLHGSRHARRSDVLTMNFVGTYDYLDNGNEWRGIRTTRYSYCHRIDGRVELYDLKQDPLQSKNLASDPAHDALVRQMACRLQALLHQRGDGLVPADRFSGWFDQQRRVVRNAFGPLGSPESPPDRGRMNP